MALLGPVDVTARNRGTAGTSRAAAWDNQSGGSPTVPAYHDVPAYHEIVMRGLRRLSDALEREHARLGIRSPRDAVPPRTIEASSTTGAAGLVTGQDGPARLDREHDGSEPGDAGQPAPER